MPRIPGYYEYDDGDLTPGNKKEGGLHQNLYDGDGNLRGSARFVPDGDADANGEATVAEFQSASAGLEESTRRSPTEQDERVELLTRLAGALLAAGIEFGMPRAKRVWSERVLPTVRHHINRLGEHRPARDRRKGEESQEADGAKGPESPRGTVVDFAESGARMTSSEARARYLLALAARQFSDREMWLLAHAQIGEDGHLQELGRALSELPPDQLVEMLEELNGGPSSLGGGVPAQRETAAGIERVDRSPASLERRQPLDP